MMNNSQSSRISETGELGFLEHLLPRLSTTPDPRIRIGPGDDACVLNLSPGSPLAVTTDMMVEGVHFKIGWQTPEELGYKAVAVNLSDIAAMGAKPESILVSLGCPPQTEIHFLERLFEGMLELCRETGISITGGNTCRSDAFILSLTALGSCGEGAPISINHAQPGEILFTSACPGLSGLGLRLLERFGRQNFPKNYPEALIAHLKPRISWKEAPWIASLVQPGAMTDISDGLGRDLSKICRTSKVGAWIDFSSLLWHKELLRAQDEFGWDPVEFVLQGGEDYCLLFCAIPDRIEKAKKESQTLSELPLVEIGKILKEDQGLIARFPDGRESRIDPAGFDHFKYRIK